MKFLILPAAILLGFEMTSPAMADRNPQPPPSGIVIHLFGQNSMMSNVMPTTSAAPSANNGSALGAGAQNSSNNVEPSAGEIVHQMFVTGDPNNPSKPAPGRTADRPAN